MADLENNLKDIFVSNLRSKNKTKAIYNTPQASYIQNGVTSKAKTLKSILKTPSQNGGKTDTKTDKKKKVDQTETETSANNESESDSESGSESGSESESDQSDDNIDEDDPNEEPIDEYEANDVESEPNGAESEDADDGEDDDTKEDDAEPETEYNEDADAEKDTEMNPDGDIEECLYQVDDLVEERDTDRQAREIPKDQRKTDSQMTHYERIRILGVRSKQIAMGAKVMVKYDNNTLGAVELAKYELNKKTTPLIIKRPLPDNTYELWEVSELMNDDDPTNLIIKDLNESFKSFNNNQTFNLP